MSTISADLGTVQSAAQIYAFKQAEAASASQVKTLLESLPSSSGSTQTQAQEAPQYVNPDNLGQNIDIKI